MRRIGTLAAALLLASGCTDYEEMARHALEDDYDELTLEPTDDEQTYDFSGIARSSGEECSGSVHVEGSASSSTSRVTATCGLPDDPERLATACRGGNATACARVARDLREGDPDRALELARVGCDGRDGSACFQAGVLQEMRDEHTRAHGFYVRGCDAGNRAACFNAAIYERDAQGTDADRPRALRRFTTLCEEEGQLRLEGCTAAGEILVQGGAVEADHPRAMGMAERACEGENAGGCALVAFLLVDGQGVPHDHERAFRVARTACEGEVGMGCRILGLLEREGLGRPADADAALGWFERACGLGDQFSCQQRDALGG